MSLVTARLMKDPFMPRLLTLLVAWSALTIASHAEPPQNVATKQADTAYEAAVIKAENAFLDAKRKAHTDRLKVYQAELASATKAGNFDGASALKQAIEKIETDPDAAPLKVKKKPKDAQRFGNHTYAVIPDRVTWHVAKRRCEELGGHLVCMETPQEERFVRNLMDDTTGESVWIGATDEETEGTWLWVNGKPITTVRVPDSLLDAENKYAEHHIAYNKTGRAYNDWFAGGRIWFVCEWDN